MDNMQRSIAFAIALSIYTCAAFSPATAQAATCKAADFGAVVDQTAQALRTLNVDGAQRFQAKMASLRQKLGLTQEEIDARTITLQDDKIVEFNGEIDSLVSQMDSLSQVPNNLVTCEKLDDLKRVRDRLLTVMGQKSGYMLARADTLFSAPPAGVRPAKPAAPADSPTLTPAPAPAVTAKPVEVKPAPVPVAAAPIPVKPAAPADAKPSAPTLAPAPVPVPERRSAALRSPSDRTAWTPERQPTAPRSGGEAGHPQGLQGPDNGTYSDPAVLPPPVEGSENYSMNEIRDAGRGIFGSITSELAGAINYAFQNFGQPNSYIIGNEGGGAFLAGLRYGKGMMNRKGIPESVIYWQGPSAGLDLGAEGSKTLFLVYNLDDPQGIYGRFSGIGGSAYVAGGVGINVLGKGNVVIVPIRTGLGLRLGANLAYLKFTERQTWNPF